MFILQVVNATLVRDDPVVDVLVVHQALLQAVLGAAEELGLGLLALFPLLLVDNGAPEVLL
jgi:hypothetical protein